MHIVILGASRIGVQIARQLVNENKKVTVIEQDQKKAEQLSNQVDCMVVNDHGNSPQVLKKAGVETADFFVAVTESDEINIISCGMVAADFTRPKTIARVRNLEYYSSKLLDTVSPLFGIDFIINSDIEAARVVLRAISQGAKRNVLLFDHGDLELSDLIVSKSFPYLGKTVSTVRQSEGGDFLIILLLREDVYMIPDGQTVIYEDDQLFILGNQEKIDRIITENGTVNSPINKIAIVGGSKLAQYVAGELKGGTPVTGFFGKLIARFLPNRAGQQVHFIDRDYQKCKLLSERFPNALVTHADISEEGFLEDGTVDGYDLLITATDNQELNILTAMYAKKAASIGRTIALVQKRGYTKVSQSLGIDVTISLNGTMINSILRIIRGGSIHNVHTIADGPFGIIEFTVAPNSLIDGKRIRDIRMQGRSLIVLVVKNERYMIPYGDLVIESGDRVLLIAEEDKIPQIEQTVIGQ